MRGDCTTVAPTRFQFNKKPLNPHDLVRAGFFIAVNLFHVKRKYILFYVLTAVIYCITLTDVITPLQRIYHGRHDPGFKRTHHY
jgi:hypothetical protein